MESASIALQVVSHSYIILASGYRTVNKSPGAWPSAFSTAILLRPPEPKTLVRRYQRMEFLASGCGLLVHRLR